MAHATSDSAASLLSNHGRFVPVHCNQRDYDEPTDDTSDALRRVLLQQGFMAKPTAYAPYGKQEDHPLHDPYRQLQARLQAVREVRSRLRFVSSSASASASASAPASASGSVGTWAVSGADYTDVEMKERRDSMTITTRVALSAQATTDEWIQRGGIVALDGLETLFLGFLTTHELVTAGAVCQSWYALARRDVLWEPLLQTPVEKYPLRAFLGFHTGASVPAIQVYIIYRKLRAQLQTLHAKDDETPRQSPDAVRFEEVMLRFRRAGNDNTTHQHHPNNNNNNDHDHDHDHDVIDDELALFAHARGDLPPPFALPVMHARRRTARATTTTTTATATRRLHLRSVHLVFPADEDLGVEEEETEGTDEDTLAWVNATPPPVQAQAHLHNRVPFFAAHDIESDEEVVDDGDANGDGDGDGDVAMLAPDGTSRVRTHPPPAATSIAASPAAVLESCRRVRLQTWLSQRRAVSRDVFRSFARQLLLALATLEVSQITHSDVCSGNILVLERHTTKTPLPHASPFSAQSNQGLEETQELPLFQLYCRSAVNTWSTTGHTLPSLGREQPPTQPPINPRGGHADALALRMRHRHFRMMAAVGAPPDANGGNADDDDQLMLRRLFALRPMPHADDGVMDIPPPPPPPPLPIALPPPPPPMAPQAPSSASLTSMVRSYLRILREVWSHGRVASATERSLPFLSLVFLRPELVKSRSFRSFLEFAEYLLSRNVATPTTLLHHVFLQQDDAPPTSSSSPRRRHYPSASIIIGRSALSPLTFANADEYRTHAIAWYARYLANRQPPRGLATSLASLGSFGSRHSFPSTLFGPAFFHDALSESRLPSQRFLSVAAPRTATSSWVHTLAVSQRWTLQQLDLAQVQLPLSILLRELVYLQRLTHLRLPRAILRDENMEQFVAAVWCSGLLPTLKVMDDTVRTALNRMETSYLTQLHIMSSFLDHNQKSQPDASLQHTFSAPI